MTIYEQAERLYKKVNTFMLTCPDFCVLRFVPVSGRFYSDFTINEFTI